MTSDELERAIEILLKNQANFDARQEKTDQQFARTDQQLARTDQQIAQTIQQIEQTNLHLAAFSDIQSEFIQVSLQQAEAQDAINAEMRQITRELSKAQEQTQRDVSSLAQAQEQTQRDVSTLAQMQQSTQQEISDLASVVRHLMNVSGNGNSSQE